MIPSPPEQALVDVLVSHYEPTYHVACEVKWLYKRIDLVLQPRSGGEVWTIEAKVSNWQKAFQQAYIEGIAAHRVWIAMWDRTVHRVDLARMDRFGVGVLSVGLEAGAVKVIQTPPLCRHRHCERIEFLRSRAGFIPGPDPRQALSLRGVAA